MGGHHTVEEELNIDLLAPESLLSSLTPATKKQLVPPILKLNDNDLLITSVIFLLLLSLLFRTFKYIYFFINFLHLLIFSYI